MKLRLIPDNTEFDFIKHRFIAFALSAAIIFGSFYLVFDRGLNFGIDFTGGTLIEVRVPSQPDLGDLRRDLNALGLGAVSIQEFGTPTDLLIRLQEQDGGQDVQSEALRQVRETLDQNFSDGGVEYRRTEFVGPQVGDELKKQGLYAVLFAMAGILAYVWFRFEWQFGVAALAALAHDVIATIGLFALTGMQFDLSTVAAILMIAGYSINDTVVIFDRIREVLRKYKKKPLPDILNKAINETLARTIVTGVTTLLALLALWTFGGEVIQGFVNALIFGIIIGTHSSIFVASPILLYLNVRRSAADDGVESSANSS